MDKIGQLGPFFELDKRQRKADILLFEDELINEETVKKVQRKKSTLIIEKIEERKENGFICLFKE